MDTQVHPADISMHTDEPMLVNCVAYGKDGRKARDVTLDDISEVLKNPDQFIWVGLHEPDEPLLAKLQEEFGLHDLAIEDAHCAHQRPKIELYDDTLLMVLHTAQVLKGMINEEVKPYLRDVYDHAARISDATNTMGELLSSAMNVNLALVSVAQNEVVKRLAGWAGLLAAPTLIASWYGMNFKNMPELGHENGYFVLIGVTVAVCVGLYLLLRRAKWL